MRTNIYCCTTFNVSSITTTIYTGSNCCIRIYCWLEIIVSTDDIYSGIFRATICSTDINQGITFHRSSITAAKHLTNLAYIWLFLFFSISVCINISLQQVDIDMSVTNDICSLTISTAKDLTNRSTREYFHGDRDSIFLYIGSLS